MSDADRPTFTSIFANLAFMLAERSTCSRLKVGCVIASTDHRKVISIGYNGGASGQDNACESLEPGLCGHLHAEDNAIVNCDAPRGTPKNFYCTNLPCPMCCKRIVNLGHVEKVFYAEEYRATAGSITLQKAGIQLVRLRAARRSAFTPAVWIVGEEA